MATLSLGLRGGVTFAHGGVIARSWSAQISRPFVDTTAFGDWSPRRQYGGGNDITGTITGMLDVAGTGASVAPSPLVWAYGDAAAAVTLSVETNTGSANSIQFPALVETADLSVAYEGISEVTYNFALGYGTTATSFAFSNICTVTWT